MSLYAASTVIRLISNKIPHWDELVQSSVTTSIKEKQGDDFVLVKSFTQPYTIAHSTQTMGAQIGFSWTKKDRHSSALAHQIGYSDHLDIILKSLVVFVYTVHLLMR